MGLRLSLFLHFSFRLLMRLFLTLKYTLKITPKANSSAFYRLTPRSVSITISHVRSYKIYNAESAGNMLHQGGYYL